MKRIALKIQEKIVAEFNKGKTTYAKLAEKYKISATTVFRYVKKPGKTLGTTVQTKGELKNEKPNRKNVRNVRQGKRSNGKLTRGPVKRKLTKTRKPTKRAK